ncbi:MAG: 23S rRNA (pseudouridine(1915)-N(3))-methyltransferase RlmH [Nanoarchaeota archaeon]|nr:23S rRNA (pseudouridine(1915)-N(3))-methyltransferase RlmH [Nanoarchaeota archaeon]
MITIITDGNIKQKELASLSDIYLKRISTFPATRIKFLTITKDFEEKIRSLNKKSGHRLFLLAEQGKEVDSKEFMEFLRPNFESGESFTLVIGPPEGFSDELKKECDAISLSRMTFPHEVAQVILLEQIYRACCLFTGKDYHK